MPWLLALYTLASLAHFIHNAENLVIYPNLPAWLSRSDVYMAWCAITAVGIVGYSMYLRSHSRAGLGVLAAYATLGFAGLLHYRRAPMMAHTGAMNLTIWFEVAAAALVLVALVRIAVLGGGVSAET